MSHPFKQFLVNNLYLCSQKSIKPTLQCFHDHIIKVNLQEVICVDIRYLSLVA